MKVLVTGATGFVGNYVIDFLLQNKHKVTATSSSAQKARQLVWYKNVKYIPFDFKDFDNNVDYFSFFDRPEIMIHLGWEGLPNFKAAYHLEENLSRHKFFLANILKNGLKKLTVTGTCLEYGMQQGCLSETMNIFPANSYAIAKDELRKYLEQLKAHYGFQLNWLRLFYINGKGQNSKSLFSQLEKALEDNEPVFNMSGGEQVRDFLPIEKMAEYIVRIAFQDRVSGIINCCSGIPVTIKKLVQNYLSEQKKHITLNFGYYPYPDYEPMQFWGDNTKLKSILTND